MNGLRSLSLDRRVAAVLSIIASNRPRDTKMRVCEQYLNSKKIKIFRGEIEPLVLIEVEVYAWGNGKPVVRYRGDREVDPARANKEAAHAIARDIKRAGRYFGDVLVQDPNYIAP